MLPLQVGVPGGMELVVIFIIAVLLFGVPIVLLAGGLYLYRQAQSDDSASEEVESLRREVERLREEVDRLDDEKE
jgi:sec-independent protein translocase protein TatA